MCGRSPPPAASAATSPTRGEVSCGRPPGAPVVTWLERSPLVADELVRSRPGAHATRSPAEQKKVEEWLGEKLAAGPKLAKEIDEQAKLDEIPPVLLRRATITLGVVHSGVNGSTMWKLPDVSASAEFPLPLAGEGLELRGDEEPGAAGEPVASLARGGPGS
jgi:hypothetical protein